MTMTMIQVQSDWSGDGTLGNPYKPLILTHYPAINNYAQVDAVAPPASMRAQMAVDVPTLAALQTDLRYQSTLQIVGVPIVNPIVVTEGAVLTQPTNP